jgi:hypothetical protein
LNDVPLGERISKEVEGFPTDVIAHDLPTPCDDTGNYRPVLGGIQIRVKDTLGTLGCIVMDTTDESICILSNEHVLLKTNEVVYQPKDKTICQTIGRTKRLRLSQYVDGGIASLDNVVNLAKIVDIGNVTGIHEATGTDLDQTMRKRGKTTGLTTAPLLFVNYDGTKRPDNSTMLDQLVIGNSGGKHFMGHGDSGSVAVNGKDEVIGLLWGVVEAEGWGIASPIKRVMDELEIKVITSSSVYVPPAYSETIIGKLEALLHQSSRWRGYWEAYRQHETRVIHMFHETPRLYAIWLQMPHGELQDAIEAAVTDPDSKIPSTIGGHDTAALMAKFRDTFARYTKDNVDLQRQADSLHNDIVNNIGRAWRNALGDGKAAS